MKNFLIGFFFVFGTSLIAQVKIGDKITSNLYNNSKFQIGDIKDSILSENEFFDLHGNCWVKLDSSISLSGTDLGDHIDNIGSRTYSTISNLSGNFTRNSGGKSANLGSLQDYATVRLTGSITHKSLRWDQRVSAGSSSSMIYLTNAGGNGVGGNADSKASVVNIDSERVLGSNHVTSGSSSDIRPDNITINMFVKVNNNCL